MDVTIYLVYRSPNAQPEAMAELAQLVRTADKNSVIIGDFNLPEIDWERGTTAARSRDFVEAVEDSLMEQLVSFSTQVSGNILDLVLTNIPERIEEVSEEGRLGSSDHDMIGLKISCGATRVKAKAVKNWRRANWEAMRNEMGRKNWRRLLKGTADEM
jgi:endonuclease/exonuclease/phosphatase family metal-dependent hydrolase